MPLLTHLGNTLPTQRSLLDQEPIKDSRTFQFDPCNLVIIISLKILLMNELHLEPETTLDSYSLFVVLPAVILLISVGLFFFKKWVDGPIYSVPPLDLKGKHAIVTGGNTGIGF